jgi:hypothetical protein
VSIENSVRVDSQPGKNRRWVEDQAATFIRKVAPYGFVRPVAAAGFPGRTVGLSTTCSAKRDAGGSDATHLPTEFPHVVLMQR